MLTRTANRDLVFSDPETDLEIVREQLASIDPSICHAAFKGYWHSPGYHLVLTTRQKNEDMQLEMAALFEDARGKNVDPPAAQDSLNFAYTDFGAAGDVSERKEIEDLGITQLTLTNHVRINLKPTTFEQGKIRLHARIGSGRLSQPRDMPMLDLFSQSLYAGGGLGEHSLDELQQILAGKNVNSALGIADDAFILSGTTTPQDFLLQCQLMCASLIDPGYREESLWQFQKELPAYYQQLRHTLAGPQSEMKAWLHGNDSRFSVASEGRLATYTIEDATSWLTPELSQGYLELSVVGDFNESEILPGLLATFGALPVRNAEPAALEQERQIEVPEPPQEKEWTYPSKIPQGLAIVVWKT
ncbi:MAG: hypothetical protein ACO3RV_10425, partial [Luteolibacter sp.]